MKKLKVVFLLTLLPFFFNSCSYKLLQPTVINKGDINQYSYFFIQPTETLTSGTGGTDYFGNYYSKQKSINPADIITGFLVKKGFVKLFKIDKELLNKTLIVTYGESGRRNVGFGGYTIEVIIQLIDGQMNSLVTSCVAEGIGSTEADDIRIAINRCLSSIYGENDLKESIENENPYYWEEGD